MPFDCGAGQDRSPPFPTRLPGDAAWPPPPRVRRNRRPSRRRRSKINRCSSAANGSIASPARRSPRSTRPPAKRSARSPRATRPTSTWPSRPPARRSRTARGRRWTPRERGRLLNKLADLIEKNIDELAALETLDNGKPHPRRRWPPTCRSSIDCYRYYAGWADKIEGKTIPVDGPFFCYTRHEPVGVVGQIIPWNFPLLMHGVEVGPGAGRRLHDRPEARRADAADRAARGASWRRKPASPTASSTSSPAIGETAGAALAEHTDVDKIAFTGEHRRRPDHHARRPPTAT